MEYELRYELKCGIFERMDNMRKNVKLTGVFAVVLAVVLAWVPAASAVPVVLTGSLSWDGTYGAYLAPGNQYQVWIENHAVPTWLEGNLARGPVVTAVGSGELGELSGAYTLYIANINDGNYGADWGWINEADLAGWVGVALGERVTVDTVAFSKSNTAINPYPGRVQGTYEVQYTDDDPNWVTTWVTSQVDPNWVTIGSVTLGEEDTSSEIITKRKEFTFPKVQATGFRLKTIGPFGLFSPLIDEIELYNKEPIKASKPVPGSSIGSFVDPDTDLLLQWEVLDDGAAGPGTITGYHVYFDPIESNLETTGDKGIVTAKQYPVTAAELAVNTVYFWRIDVIYNDGGVVTVVEGDVWTFTAGSTHTFTVQAFYNFEGTIGGSTNPIVDSSGNGKNMAVFNGTTIEKFQYGTNAASTDVPTFVGGSVPGVQSLNFKGYAGYKINEALTGVDNCVFEAYAKPSASINDWFYLAGVGGWVNGLGLGGAVNNDNKWGVKYQEGPWRSTGVQRDPRFWIHIALVRGTEFNNGKTTLFINHEKVFEFTPSPAPAAPDAYTFVGAQNVTGQTYAFNQFIGLLDNVRFSTFTGQFKVSDLMPKCPVVCGVLGQVYKPMDFNTDCYVNLLDFAEFASAWLDCTDPQNTGLCDSWNGE
jgi:hypothetical protein